MSKCIIVSPACGPDPWRIINAGLNHPNNEEARGLYKDCGMRFSNVSKDYVSYDPADPHKTVVVELADLLKDPDFRKACKNKDIIGPGNVEFRTSKKGNKISAKKARASPFDGSPGREIFGARLSAPPSACGYQALENAAAWPDGVDSDDDGVDPFGLEPDDLDKPARKGAKRQNLGPSWQPDTDDQFGPEDARLEADAASSTGATAMDLVDAPEPAVTTSPSRGQKRKAPASPATSPQTGDGTRKTPAKRRVVREE